MSGKSSVKIRFQGHGFGDAVQLGIVLKHLKHYHPETLVCCQSDEGTPELFNKLIEKPELVTWPWQSYGYHKGFYLHWERAARSWANVPSTKPTQCLETVFELEPIESLYSYDFEPTSEDFRKVDAWLSKQELGDYKGFVLLHWQGRSSPERKNLSIDEAYSCIWQIIGNGFRPVILDFNPWKPDPLLANSIAVCPYDLWQQNYPLRFAWAPAGILAALIQRATYFVGIDSGPEHLAAATGTPTIVIWKDFHPIHNFDLSGNVIHLVPENHERWIEKEGEPEAALEYFKSRYAYHELSCREEIPHYVSLLK